MGRRHVLGPSGNPKPVVLLLGCNTDNTGLPFESFVPAFADQQAAVIGSCVTAIALKVERYDPARGGRFDSWVFTLAYHALADWWRTNPPEISLPDDLAASLVFDEVDEADPRALPEVVDAVRDAVARLPERDQALLHHRDLGDMQPMARLPVSWACGR